MRDFSRSQFASSLLQLLTSRVAADRMTTAELLADLAEVDRRRLCVGAGYPSQHAYCVRELQMSEDAASKRIHAARAARDVPQIFEAVADGRLHLASVVLLAPHLTLENAEALLSSAARKTKREVEQLIASRFPRAELLPMVLATPRSADHAPGHVEALGAAAEHAPGHVPPAPSRLTPIASDRDAWHFSVPREMTELLEYA